MKDPCDDGKVLYLENYISVLGVVLFYRFARYRPIMFHCFIVLHRCCVCDKLKVCDNPASKQVCNFSNNICSLCVSASHFSNSQNI